MKEITKLKKLIKSKKAKICLRKVQCIYLQLAHGWKSEEIAEVVGYTPSYVRMTQSAYKKEGEQAFYLQGRTGSQENKNLPLEEEEALISQFEEKSKTGSLVEISEIHQAYCQKVEERLGKTPHKASTYRMLKRHGWRKVMPRPKHTKNSPAALEAFKKGGVWQSDCKGTRRGEPA
jgi:transposase